MRQEDFFGNAKWILGIGTNENSFSIIRGYFDIQSKVKVSLNILGLGFFKCYINGVCINPDTFLPLSSDYEASCDPQDEILSGHRIYVPSFDISQYVKIGKNIIDIHFGGGWYTMRQRSYGVPKAIYAISVCDGISVTKFVSDESCLIKKSFVSDYFFLTHESHNYLDFELDGGWSEVTLAEPLVTEYCETDCPTDKLIETLTPVKVSETERGIIYDCGENTTGYPVLMLPDGSTEEITVNFSEGILYSGELDPNHVHKQKFTVIGDGKQRTVQPEFTWFGFRYFEICGNADPVEVKIVHADVPVSSSFECDNETLNWIYNTFIHTMLCNMHTGHPSDCPHIERRGYTGDGQLTCHTVLTLFDAKSFYEKWLQDIADGQDTLTGHVQYTAPYIKCGGGPGGWGCAIVEVPYQLYRHYGDSSILKKYYGNMQRYIDFLEDHSEFGLVTSDKDNASKWCLGDWCGPNILYPDKDITRTQQMLLPPAMVNTYFLVKSLNTLCEIAKILGKPEDAEKYHEKAEERKRAVTAAYFNRFDNNFIMNAQGANAFAVDIGLGTDATYKNMINYYKKLGHYDTGIFGTDILTRVLFERGDAELAVDLLTNNGDQGFKHWRKNGATTFHEFWNSNRSRSHNHPMFGSPVAYMFEYLLGIRQSPESAGYASLVIEPLAVNRFGYMRGSMETVYGTVAVSYENQADAICFKITVPESTKAIFKHREEEYSLSSGENEIFIKK